MKKTRIIQLSSELRRRLVAAISSVGDASLARRTQVSRYSLARAAAGLPIRRGTQLAIELALDETKPEDGEGAS